MYTERQMFGPPGCGKTYNATRMVRRAAHEYGDDKVMVASFTKAAAKEIAGRDLGRVKAATLHSHCWHGLDRPVIAETRLKEWNETHPGMLLSGQGVDVDGGLSDHIGKTEADEYMSTVQRMRGALIPKEVWGSTQVTGFHEEWEDWKTQCGYRDFTDLIEDALKSLVAAPGDPRVGVFDEAQDFTPMQLALVRKWAAYMEHILTIGDDDQILYAWAGCTPEAFLSDAIPDEHKIILSQSYRVPRAVQRVAEAWIKRVAKRQAKLYNPREEEGEVRRSQASIMGQPGHVINLAEERVANGQSVMLLATCGYMLDGVLKEMRERGLPFHNPYRESHGGWNPLGVRKGVSSAQRLLSFMRINERPWTHTELAQWVEPLAADGLLKRGAKQEIQTLSESKDSVNWDWLAERFHESALNGMYDGDVDWFRQHLLASKAKPYQFLFQVLEKRGASGLTDTPRVIIGTVHSVKGGESDCSPPDEPVLTTNRGWVAIGDLDPEADRLVSFNSDHHKIHRGGPRRPDGYQFSKVERPYAGDLLTLTTDRSVTRVTPNHHLTIRWSANAINGYAVYLMRRGNWWRIGVTRLHQTTHSASGITIRMAHEKAEAAWVLGVFDTYRDALYHETLWSRLYQVPDLTFEQRASNGNQLDSALLCNIWMQIDSESGALGLLAAKSMHPDWPLWGQPKAGTVNRRRQTGQRNRWTARAANLLPGYMEIPTDPGKGQEPSWQPFTVDKSSYTGNVYSLDVERWHHYVSGGAVVHNCVFLAPDLSRRALEDSWEASREGRDSIIRTAYVGATRARQSLILLAPSTSRQHWGWMD